MKKEIKDENEQESIYHDTWTLLKNYRDAVWSLEVSVRKAEREFRKEYGSTIDEYLDSIYKAGAELAGTKLESHAQCIERSHKMLEMLDTAIDMLRCKHMFGETYYWILYYTYLIPQRLPNLEAILDKLKPYMRDCSRASYYSKRRAAIEALGAILWGYTSKECQSVLDKLIPPDQK